MVSAVASTSPRPGDQLELVVTGLNHRAEGVSRLPQGQVCFVPGALPGEVVRVKLSHPARRHWLAELVAVVQPSEERCRPACILAARCGGCSLQHWSAQAQSQWKQQVVVDALERIGHLRTFVRPILAAAEPLAYRNRAVIPVERTNEGLLRAGYYRRGSHRIVNMNRCPVLDPRLDALIAPLKQDLERSGWPASPDAMGEGGLRHLALRVGRGTGELLITLISSHDNLPDLDALASRWMERWPSLVGVCLNLQPRPTNTLMGEFTRTVDGRGWVQEDFAGLRLHIGADTFFQVNTSQAERVVPLLSQALQRLRGGRGAGVLVDAYCGIGTYSLPLARDGWQVRGLERNPEAVRLARLNADKNKLSERCRFDAVDVDAALADQLPGSDVLFVDPPRKGLDPRTLAVVLASPPPVLLYLSCDPATLARDLGLLTERGGYTLEEVQPIDFFPQTSHVETLAVLHRKNALA
jgi:23S rRNA (uracil1939-C5)-methyltransferase